MARAKDAPGLVRLADSETHNRSKSPVLEIVRPEISLDSVFQEAEELESLSLDQLASEIRNRRHRQVGDAVLLGSALIVAKTKLKHGAWEGWLQEVGYSVRTAERDMELARAAHELRKNDNLRFSSARELLAVAKKQGILPNHNRSLKSARHVKLIAVLHEHVFKTPLDMKCSCGVEFSATHYEAGLDAWIQHVISVLDG